MTRQAQILRNAAAALLIQVTLFGLGALTFEHPFFAWATLALFVLLILVVAADIRRDLRERAADRKRRQGGAW